MTILAFKLIIYICFSFYHLFFIINFICLYQNHLIIFIIMKFFLHNNIIILFLYLTIVKILISISMLLESNYIISNFIVNVK